MKGEMSGVGVEISFTNGNFKKLKEKLKQEVKGRPKFF